MAVQPSIRPDSPSSFFPDGRAARPAVANTVARGHLRTDLGMYTGRTTRRDRAWAVPAALLGALAGHGASAASPRTAPRTPTSSIRSPSP